MQCAVSSVELEVVVGRIRNHTINLQPDYQRGEVWSVAKKQKLIDTIIRKWMMPPIHLITNDNDVVEEVLDGQQRLVAIRDFFDGNFCIDGNIHPISSEVQALDGMYFDDLPNEIRFRIERYSLTFIKLYDYLPEEPAELFNRLNQPASLTAAEKRNAYIGDTRRQIRNLADVFVDKGASKDLIGFSNSRLAYDEVISKFAFMIEINSMKKKITAGDISKRYQEDIIFDLNTIDDVYGTIEKFISAIKIVNNESVRVKLSKATILSWWIYIYKNFDMSDEDVAKVIAGFETSREYLKGKHYLIGINTYSTIVDHLYSEYPFFETMINVYNQRASMGSTDALSIIYRDIIIHIYAEMARISNPKLINTVIDEFEKTKNFNTVLESINDMNEWGRIIK